MKPSVQIALSLIVATAAMIPAISYFIDRNEENQRGQAWTSEDREAVYQSILKSAPEVTAKYPEITRIWSECATDRIVQSMTRDRYIEIANKPDAEEIELLMPVIQDCLTEFRRNMDSATSESQ